MFTSTLKLTTCTALLFGFAFWSAACGGDDPAPGTDDTSPSFDSQETSAVDTVTGEEPTGGEPTGGEPTGGEPTGGEPTGGELTGGEPTGGEPTGGEPTGGEPTGGEPTGGEPTSEESSNSGEEPSGQEPSNGGEDEVTLQTIHTEIFQGTCTGCHGGSGGLSLANNDGLYDRLLANSNQLPSMPRITPGDAQESYLWHKMAGTHQDAGGTGATMPPGGPLSSDVLDLLLDWIEDGAPE